MRNFSELHLQSVSVTEIILVVWVHLVDYNLMIRQPEKKIRGKMITLTYHDIKCCVQPYLAMSSGLLPLPTPPRPTMSISATEGVPSG